MRATIILTIMIALYSGVHAMGKKPLMENKFQLMEKLSDKVVGLESKIDKVDAKVDGQVSAIAGFNNQVNKMSSEIRATAGRDNNINDAGIFKAQLDAQVKISEIQKESSKDRENVWKALFYWLIGVLTLTIRLIFKFFNKYMFYKEQTYLRLDSDDDVQKMKDLQKERTVLSKTIKTVKQIMPKKESKNV